MDTSSIVELAVITGLTELVKDLIPAKWDSFTIPLAAVVFGVVIHLLLYQYSNLELVNGIVLGLTSAGLYKAGNTAIDRLNTTQSAIQENQSK